MTEQEEFEFRLRLEQEQQGARAPKKDDTAARAVAAGASMRDGKVNWAAELEKQAIDEQSLGGRVFRSLGAGFADIPLAVRQIFNRDPQKAKELEREAADKREMDKYLSKKTDLGVLPDQIYGVDTPTMGSMAQFHGKTAPSMLMPATRLAGMPGFASNVATGAALSALDPTTEGESRGMNMAMGGAASGVLPLAMSAIRPVYNAVTRGGGQNKAAAEVAKTLTQEGGDEATVLRQTIDRLKQAKQGNIPLSTAAQLSDANLARLEQGNRVRNAANWYEFDQNQARSVSDAVRQATAQAEDLGQRRALRSSNRATNVTQAMSTINEPVFLRDLQGFRNNLDVAMRTPEASDPAVRSMLTELRSELDRLGPDFTPDHLATIRANLSSKSPLVPQNAYQAAPRSSPATMSVLREVDNILNNATGNRWQKVVGDYARDSDAVRAAQAAGKVREAFWDSTGQVRKRAADTMGDVPMITEAGLRQAINSTAGPQKNLLLSNEANTRLNAIVDALRAQGIVQRVKLSASAGGGSDTVPNQFAARAAGRAADALGASGSTTAAGANAVLSKLSELATANKDKALAEALQNPQQMVALLERKLQAGAPLNAQEQYLLSVLRAAPAAAVTSN